MPQAPPAPGATPDPAPRRSRRKPGEEADDRKPSPPGKAELEEWERLFRERRRRTRDDEADDR
jgi:hypothetical protein